jgi:hypothetical protein
MLGQIYAAIIGGTIGMFIRGIIDRVKRGKK